MKERNPIRAELLQPDSAAARQELARSAARIQAEHILSVLRAMNCPVRQKLELLDAVIGILQQGGAAGEQPHG